MEYHPSLVSIHLDRLEWTQLIEATGGGGVQVQDIPTVSPYLWTIFFKTDGETLQITDAGTVSGSATVFFTPGSHGNLGVQSLQPWSSVNIPPAIGEWSTFLQPIPVAQKLQFKLGKQYEATFGVVAVLMLEEHVSDHGAEAGHAALNAAVQSALNTLLQGLNAGHRMTTQQDINEATQQIPDQVAQAIQNAQSVWENLWSYSGKDRPVDFKVIKWSQDQFINPSETQSFVQTLGEGDIWSLSGTVEVIDLCATTSAYLEVQSLGHSDILAYGKMATLIAHVKTVAGGPARQFTYDWSVIGAYALQPTMSMQPELLIEVPDKVVVPLVKGPYIFVSLTIADALGCQLVLDQFIPVLTSEEIANIEKIGQLKDSIHAIVSQLPTVLLNPAGPDPGPEPLLLELYHYAEELAQFTQNLITLHRSHSDQEG